MRKPYQTLVFPKVPGIGIILTRGNIQKHISLKQAKDEVFSAVLRGEGVHVYEENEVGVAITFYTVEAIQQAMAEMRQKLGEERR